jgi:hypothetical protein
MTVARQQGPEGTKLKSTGLSPCLNVYTQGVEYPEFLSNDKIRAFSMMPSDFQM